MEIGNFGMILGLSDGTRVTSGGLSVTPIICQTTGGVQFIHTHGRFAADTKSFLKWLANERKCNGMEIVMGNGDKSELTLEDFEKWFDAVNTTVKKNNLPKMLPEHRFKDGVGNVFGFVADPDKPNVLFLTIV